MCRAAWATTAGPRGCARVGLPVSSATRTTSSEASIRRSTIPRRVRRDARPAARSSGRPSAGPASVAWAWRSRSAGMSDQMIGASRLMSPRSQSSSRGPPARAARSVSTDGRAAASAAAPTAACTRAAPASMPSTAATGASPPGPTSDSSTGMPVISATRGTKAASSAGRRCPARSTRQIAAAPGKSAIALASSSQRRSVGPGAGPSTSVGTSSAPPATAASATGRMASASFSGSITRIRRAPLSHALITSRLARSGPTGRSPNRVRAATTTPTGTDLAACTATRRRSHGLSARPSSAPRALNESSASSATAPELAS